MSEIGSSLKELGNNVKDAFSAFQAKILDSMGFKSGEDVVEEVRHSLQNYGKKLEEIKKSLQETLEKKLPRFDDIMKNAESKISEITKSLEAQSPEVFKAAKEYQAVLKDSFSQMEKLRVQFDEQKDKMNHKAGEAIDQVLEVTLEAFRKISKEIDPKKDAN